MRESITEELRRRVESRAEEAEIEAAFAEVDERMRLLVELIDSAHQARVAELEREAAELAASPPRAAR